MKTTIWKTKLNIYIDLQKTIVCSFYLLHRCITKKRLGSLKYWNRKLTRNWPSKIRISNNLVENRLSRNLISFAWNTQKTWNWSDALCAFRTVLILKLLNITVLKKGIEAQFTVAKTYLHVLKMKIAPLTQRYFSTNFFFLIRKFRRARSEGNFGLR